MNPKPAFSACRACLIAFVVLVLVGGSEGESAVACGELVKIALPETTFLSAESIPAGNFTPVVGGATEPKMPSFCRVVARVDPEVKVEVWLPEQGWNRRFLATGNGGFAGAIQTYPQMADAVRRGFAVAATDAGHTGTPGDASWALGSTQRLVNFGDRALHQMTVKAKAIITQHYSTAPQRSYYNGCSTGGRQGLMEAQRYPDDFDGIVVGAPANYMVAQQIGHTGRAFALFADPNSAIPATKIPLLAKAVRDQCDAIDGVADGVLEDPNQCRPNLTSLLCSAGVASNCLTQPQIDAVQNIYAGTRNPRTNARLFPGYMPGGEEGPGGWSFTGSLSGAPQSGLSWMRYAAFENPNWDWRTFDFDVQADHAFEKLSGMVDATNPDLGAFQQRGGKLIQYHGWSDFWIAPQVSIDYATAVRTKMGVAAADDFYRLYMAPGMQHCANGPGPNLFGGSQHGAPVVEDPKHDVLSAVIAWVEQGHAPTDIVASLRASDGTLARTRKLCPFPQRGTYGGVGSTNDESNFVCK